MHLSLIGVMDVVVLKDDRIATLVVFDQSERVAPGLTSVVTFAEVDGRPWVDEWQPVALSMGVVATPVAETWEVVSGAGKPVWSRGSTRRRPSGST